MRGKTSCVIVNYNDSIRTLKLVERIKNYESLDYIIVVDNCSTDDSVEILDNFKDSKYHLIKSHYNGGYGYGNNIGAKEADTLQCDYILIANPDVEFDNSGVQKMREVLAKNTNCGVVGLKEIHLGVSGWRYTSTIDDVLSTSLFFNKFLKKRYYPKDFFAGQGCVSVDLIPGCLLLIDLNKFKQVGMYDESVFLYEEEKILYRKMTDAGYISLVNLDSSYKHMHKEAHSIKLSSVLTTKKRLIESKVYFLKKYRQLSKIAIVMADVFFSYTMLEMFVYGLLLNLKKGKK